MTRTEFEQFRDLPGKTIEVDIAFAVKKNHKSILSAERIPIGNVLSLGAKLEIHYNPDADSKVFTIHVDEAGGPICRLCVDNTPHPPYMTSHKHGLMTPKCPRDGLKLDIVDKSELDGMPLVDLFTIFCSLVNITHTGTFHPPAP